MRIGELATAAQTQSETIRYYEREGLLPEAARTEANYRTYDKSHIQRLAFIRHCRSLDMTLGEIRTLLHFKDAPTEPRWPLKVLHLWPVKLLHPGPPQIDVLTSVHQ